MSSESPSSILSDLDPTLELPDDFPDVSLVLGARIESDDVSSGSRRICSMPQADCFRPCTFGKPDERVLEGRRASVHVNGESLGSFSTQLPALNMSDFSTEDSADFMQIGMPQMQKKVQSTMLTCT